MKKILVIFLFAVIISIIIYKITFNKEINVLIIGENNIVTENIINKIKDKYNIQTFLYDKITYKELLQSIKNNDYIIVKEKNIYLNQLIEKSNIVIINANNNSYVKRCNYNRINSLYINNLNKYRSEIKSIIDKFSFSKVIFIDNKCSNIDIDEYIKEL